MTDRDLLAECGRLRAALREVRQLVIKAENAPCAAERWLERIEDLCVEALTPEIKP